MPIPRQLRVQAAMCQVLYGMPKPVRRLIAGRPIRLDGQELSLDAQLLLRLQKLVGAELGGNVERARAAVNDTRHLVGGKSIEPVSAREITIPSDGGDIPATLYTPVGLPEPSGLLVFYHGGGWVIGTKASHDNTARFLALHAGVRVLSIEYRLAPEHPFPAAVDDAVAAFDYAHAKADELGADPGRIAVGGDSAGGNLSAVTAQVTTRRGGPAPAFQLLLYPATDFSTRRRSRNLFAEDLLLTEKDFNWFQGHYIPEGADLTDPRLSPLLAEDLSGLPPAYIATAGFDPLRDEGEAYAKRLQEAGVPTALSRQSDLVHGYVQFLGVGHRFREATAEAAGALRLGLSRAS
jgi:acetyl esterase